MSGTRWTETIGGTLYGLEKFTATGADTWLNDVGVTSVDHLVVGGGGGAGGHNGFNGAGGGGGGGAVSWNTGRTVTPGLSYDVTVGLGGDADAGTDPPRSGGSSSAETDSGTVTAAGGGRGGLATSTPGAGGASGGGGAGSTASSAALAGGTGSAGGNGGTGQGSSTASSRQGGGGGGAGPTNGTNAGSGRHGGAGVNHSTHVGTTVGAAGWFGGGGGGGNNSTVAAAGGVGGTGGGGDGAGSAGAGVTIPPVAGGANTGGGGGGSRGLFWGPDGGTGVVIYRWAIVAPDDPTNVTATPALDSILLEWDPPAGGGLVTTYEVRLDGGTPTDTGGDEFFDFTGLTPGGTDYDLEVRAVGPGGESDWVLVEAATTFPTPPGYYRVELELGTLAGPPSHSWSVERGDAPAYGPELPLTLGWEISDSVVYFPAQADLTTLTVKVLANDASELADVARGDLVTFRMFVTSDPDEEPWQHFDGTVTQLESTTVPSSTDPDGRDFLLTVFCADHNARLADFPVGYTDDWPVERIFERAERICTEIGGVDYLEAEAFDGLEGWLPARPAKAAISALAALQNTFADAALRNTSDPPDTYYGRPVFEYHPPDLVTPADALVLVKAFTRRVFPDRTVTLNGDWVFADGSWTKQPGPHMPEWVIVDEGVFGTPDVGVPVVISTSLVDPPDAPDGDSAQTRGYLGESLLADGSTALDGWSTRSLRYVAGYVNPDDPDDFADPEPVRFWASFAPPSDGGEVPPIIPVIITPLSAELELNGVDYLAGTLTGARLVIPPGGEFYLEVKLRAELLPGTDLPP